jgi:hypothetical protein
MSAREMLKQDVDVMPDEVIRVLQAIWDLAKNGNAVYTDEIPNDATIAALDETDYNTYDNAEELLRSLSRFES